MDRLAMDVEAVRDALARALVSRIDTPRAEMDAVADVLTERTRVLLPATRVVVSRMPRDGFLRPLLTARLDNIKRQADTGLGDEGRYTAKERLRVLATDCQWLMIRYGLTPEIPAPADGSHKET